MLKVIFFDKNLLFFFNKTYSRVNDFIANRIKSFNKPIPPTFMKFWNANKFIGQPHRFLKKKKNYSIFSISSAQKEWNSTQIDYFTLSYRCSTDAVAVQFCSQCNKHSKNYWKYWYFNLVVPIFCWLFVCFRMHLLKKTINHDNCCIFFSKITFNAFIISTFY